MGAYDGADMCELVGTHMLNLLSKRYNQNEFGLYCHDGLAVLKNKSGLQSEQVKKNIQKIFKEHGLYTIIQCNIRQIPLSIESRLYMLSFNEKIFQEAVPPSQKTLQNSGYRHTLTYKSPKNVNNSSNIKLNKIEYDK